MGLDPIPPRPQVRFVIPGEPQVKRRPRFGKGRTYTDPGTLAAEEKIAWAFRAKAGVWRPRPDMLTMDIVFYVGTRRHRDRDNLTKLVQDALNGVAYTDDHQITSGSDRIEYDRPNPRTEVTLTFTGRLQWP